MSHKIAHNLLIDHRRGILHIESACMEQRIEREVGTLIKIIAAATPSHLFELAITGLTNIGELSAIDFQANGWRQQHSLRKCVGINAGHIMKLI